MVDEKFQEKLKEENIELSVRTDPGIKASLDETSDPIMEDPLAEITIPNDKLVGGVFAEKYQIQEVAGRGGMAAVYKALHLSLNKVVAIKVLYPHLSYNSKTILRFQQEAQVVSHLDHPGIVRLFDFGSTSEGHPYLVMEFLKGKPLSSILDEHQDGLNIELSLKYFIAMCEALSHAHKNGVVHRDLKPSNIFIEPDQDGNDCIKITDFGIAKLDASEEKGELKLTKTGEIFGSPLYMSPEQCMGKKVDHRADIYSLGCLMYETLTGKAPHEGDTAFETMHKHTTEEAVLPSKLRPEIRNFGDLEVVILKALAKKPQDRFQSMKELEDALKKATTASPNDPVNALLRIFGLAKVRSKSKLIFVIFCLGAALVSVLLILATSLTVIDLNARFSSIPRIESRAAEGTWRRVSEGAQELINSGKYTEAQAKLKEAEKIASTSNRTKDLLQTQERERMVAQIVGDTTSVQQLTEQIEGTKKILATENGLSEELKLLMEAFDSFPDQLSEKQNDKFHMLAQKIIEWSRKLIQTERFADAERILLRVEARLERTTQPDQRLINSAKLAYAECKFFQVRNVRYSTNNRQWDQIGIIYNSLLTLVAEPTRKTLTTEDLKWADAMLVSLAGMYRLDDKVDYYAKKSLAYYDNEGAASVHKAQALMLIADGFSDDFRYDAANELYKKAFEKFKANSDTANLSHCYTSIAENLIAQHKSSEARDFLIAGLQTAKNSGAVDDVLLSNIYTSLGIVLWFDNELAGANDAYLNAVWLKQQLLSPDDWVKANALENVVQSYFAKADIDSTALRKAEPYCRQWLAILELRPNETHRIELVRDRIAYIYMRTGRETEAKKMLDARLKSIYDQPADRKINVDAWLPDLVEKLLSNDEKSQLAKHLDSVVAAANKQKPTLELADTLRFYSRLYWHMGRSDSAIASGKLASQIAEQHANDGPSTARLVMQDYANILRWTDRNDEAKQIEEKLQSVGHGK